MKTTQKSAGIIRDYLLSKNIKVPFNTALELAARLGGHKDLQQATVKERQAMTTAPQREGPSQDDIMELCSQIINGADLHSTNSGEEHWKGDLESILQDLLQKLSGDEVREFARLFIGGDEEDDSTYGILAGDNRRLPLIARKVAGTPAKRPFRAKTSITSGIDNGTVWSGWVTVEAANKDDVPNAVEAYLEKEVTEWDVRIEPSMEINSIEECDEGYDPVPDTDKTDEDRNHEKGLPKELGIYRCIVAGINANGDSDFFFVKVRSTQIAANEGLHYDVAAQAAKDDGYDGPLVVFDELDAAGRSILEHFAWDTASIVGFPTEKELPQSFDIEWVEENLGPEFPDEHIIGTLEELVAKVTRGRGVPASEKGTPLVKFLLKRGFTKKAIKAAIVGDDPDAHE